MLDSHLRQRLMGWNCLRDRATYFGGLLRLFGGFFWVLVPCRPSSLKWSSSATHSRRMDPRCPDSLRRWPPNVWPTSRRGTRAAPVSAVRWTPWHGCSASSVDRFRNLTEPGRFVVSWNVLERVPACVRKCQVKFVRFDLLLCEPKLLVLFLEKLEKRLATSYSSIFIYAGRSETNGR